MKTLKTLALTPFLALPLATPAAAYPIDCAILLCMAGGFPPSAPCSKAKAEMIRRVTPWPSEPPLQVWRCPMGSAHLEDNSNMSVIPASFDAYDKSLPDGYSIIKTSEGVFVDQDDEIDFDFSAIEEFSFLENIRVFHIEYRAWWGGRDDDECKESNRSFKVTYDDNGNSTRSRIMPGVAPDWMNVSQGCPSSTMATKNFRRVGVEWTDYLGNHSYEMIDF